MYVAALIIPVKTNQQTAYVEMAKETAQVFMDDGATRVAETWADEASVGEQTLFPRSVQLETDETEVLSWNELTYRSVCDVCKEKPMADPPMPAHMECGVFSPDRMIFRGFAPTHNT